jgi:hypothetical protein
MAADGVDDADAQMRRLVAEYAARHRDLPRPGQPGYEEAAWKAAWDDAWQTVLEIPMESIYLKLAKDSLADHRPDHAIKFLDKLDEIRPGFPGADELRAQARAAISKG